ncbi:MAG: YkgJ family cysteine cluster protein [Ardenticatenaceae bacterium]|nr:YkgJ family cysteine cluster protein [Ardenticatenaceae bacterium]
MKETAVTPPPATNKMECRVGCGACCIAPSISSPIPGMPQGKPAGVRCIQLSPDNRCLLFGRPERPTVCSRFQASLEMCGYTTEDALLYLTMLETATQPVTAPSE